MFRLRLAYPHFMMIISLVSFQKIFLNVFCKTNTIWVSLCEWVSTHLMSLDTEGHRCIGGTAQNMILIK